MAGFRPSSEDNAPVSDINITPLVDVMLVLLVIFMVTTPLMENGIPIKLPKASAKALPQDVKPTTITISKDAKVYFEKEEVSLDALYPKLVNYYKDKPNKEIFVRADDAVAYGIVARAMASAKSAGIDKIGLVTEPPDSKK